MPRVFPDQQKKFELDEVFKKLSQESDVKYTGFKDKPHEERKQRFVQDLTEGHSIIVIVSTGTNLTLLFCRNALSEDRPMIQDQQKKNVDFELELGKVHLCSSFIMNGVCVKWIGWIDLETLSGKAKLLFDDHNAKIEDEIMRQVMKRKHKIE
ncbi:LOW QUALITY PROTEIN: protein brother-like [Gigantopelta aegis]|uniref:LOW QUALITY PROTEIN: protein brother-like n=1 Tax=Gigantopelta aegis TaxID=1735272 RepID=UPI001B88A220|nr:LOW QUALITY PROTEIN: protein brother-like [Gigantopelta aegis]